MNKNLQSLSLFFIVKRSFLVRENKTVCLNFLIQNIDFKFLFYDNVYIKNY